jgi:hypothetical protein
MNSYSSNNTILERFKRYKKLNKLLKRNINDAESKCLLHSQTKYYLYTFNNNIIIVKKIGNESSDGSIYLSKIKSGSKTLNFITKIQLFSDFKEMLFLDKSSKYAINNKNIHLPLFYGYLKCNAFNKLDLLLPTNITINKKLNSYNYKNKDSSEYYSIFAELADGDFVNYVDKLSFNSSKLYNAIAQCFMGIISTHNVGIYHRDSHLGNFLFHIVSSGGCIKYKYKDIEFYIENIGYNWVIWDFGRSKEITENNKQYLYDDFKILIETLLEYKPIYNDINIQDLLDKLYDIISDIKDDYLIIKKLFELNLLFSKIPIGKIITTVILH